MPPVPPVPDTRAVASLSEIAGTFDIAVLDQWGVLHDGTAPYPDAPAAVERLRAIGKRVAVLSNSGKRAAPNAERIRANGFAVADDEVITSGEALWRDAAAGRLAPFSHPYAIMGRPGDATNWAKGLNLHFAPDVEGADALFVMGLPEGTEADTYDATLDAAFARGLALVCANPDRSSPRAGGRSAVQPGALAHRYAERGGTVRWYGKPHEPVFRAVERLHPDVPRERFLMVGDSPEHDVAGAHAAGWRSALVRGGLHADELRGGSDAEVAALCRRMGVVSPSVHLHHLAA